MDVFTSFASISKMLNSSEPHFLYKEVLKVRRAKLQLLRVLLQSLLMIMNVHSRVP